MSMSKQYLCRVCQLPNLDGPICDECSVKRTGFRPGKRPATYDDPRWTRLSKRLRQDHVARYGWVCPGWNRPAHPSRDLTVDHIMALVDGGAPLAKSNCRVLCRSCNGSAGLTALNRRRRQLRAPGVD